MSWIDFHTHCLPHMDDGARDVDTSIEMLQQLRNQGVGTVVASPHFYAQKESTESFLSRRAQAYASIRQTVELLELPRVILGAEVHLIPNISAIDLTALAFGKSRYILLELPDQPYQRWLGAEIRRIVQKRKLIPVMAHMERYMEKYSARDYAEIFSIPNCVCQLSVEALSRPATLRFAKKMLRKGMRIVLGSDCHNLTTRPPNFFLISNMKQTQNTKTLLDILWRFTCDMRKDAAFRESCV